MSYHNCKHRMATVSKDESLRILASLGVHYPDNTKFASEILAEKLTRAIDIAQRAQANVPKRIDPGRITKWKKGNNASFKELMQVFQECSIEECGQNLMRELATGDRNPPLFSDVFTDIRQTLLTIVNHYAGPDKRKLFLVQDAEENYSITFRVSITTVHIAPDFDGVCRYLESTFLITKHPSYPFYTGMVRVRVSIAQLDFL